MMVVAENFTPGGAERSERRLQRGLPLSRAAKIMAPIGKAFAEAMKALIK